MPEATGCCPCDRRPQSRLDARALRRLSFIGGAPEPACPQPRAKFHRPSPEQPVDFEHQHPELHHARARHVRSGDLLAAGQRARTGSRSSCSSAAGISDAVDGYLAKRFNWTTELGAYLDPLADKALIVSIYIALAVRGELPLWLVIAVVSRDILILLAVLLSWLLAQPVRIKPLAVSKLNTLAQIVLAATVLADGAFNLGLEPAALCWCGLREHSPCCRWRAYLQGLVNAHDGYEFGRPGRVEHLRARGFPIRARRGACGLGSNSGSGSRRWLSW